MKFFTRFLNIGLRLLVLTSLTSCRTMRTSEKAVSESETASVTASRLTFYRTLDSLSRQFRLSADSIIMIFSSSPEFPSELPSEMEGLLETPSDSQSIANNPAHKRIRNASRSESALRPSQSLPKSLNYLDMKFFCNSTITEVTSECFTFSAKKDGVSFRGTPKEVTIKPRATYSFTVYVYTKENVSSYGYKTAYFDWKK